MLNRWNIPAIVLVLATVATAQAKDPVFDVAALTATPLHAKVLDTKEENGIVTEQVMFHSEDYKGNSVDIFAFVVYPKGAKNLPAFIWNQGGLGKADAHLITHYGAKRGYVGMCIDFPMPGYRSTGGFNIVSGLDDQPNAFDSTISRGVVALLKAVSYLQTRPEVDKEKIGMCGSSWGGFYTTLMVGIDPRLKVGSAMFGCGFLETGNNWWGVAGTPTWHGPADTKHWVATLDPGPRLANTKTPIGWFTGTNDMFYFMDSLMRSYDTAAGPKHLTLLANYAHGLNPKTDDAVFEFLDVHLKGEPALLKVTPLEIAKDKPVATWKFEGSRKAVSANIIVSAGGPGNWPYRAWTTMPATISGNTITATLPASSAPYYVSGSVVDSDGFTTSTPLVLIPAANGVSSGVKLEFDGASEWGNFEEYGVWWQRAHAFMNPTVSPDAHGGKQSIVLDDKKPTRLYPLYFYVGVKHRLSMFMKADKEIEVDVRLGGSFDGKKFGVERKAKVGTTWTEVTLDAELPNAWLANLSADVVVPEGAKVLLDDLSFRPVEAK